MNIESNLIDLNAERSKRIHDVHDKRLQEVRQAFEQALPLSNTGKNRKKGKSKKR